MYASEEEVDSSYMPMMITINKNEMQKLEIEYWFIEHAMDHQHFLHFRPFDTVHLLLYSLLTVFHVKT